VIPGELRWRIAVERDAFAPDDLGQLIATPAAAGTYWGKIVTLAGREAVNAKQVKAETSHRVTLRWPGASATITPKDRLTYKGRTFQVLWIDNLDERNRQLDVYCQEVVSPP
jgi:SPP1 family predicted phage head-tail adaptor